MGRQVAVTESADEAVTREEITPSGGMMYLPAGDPDEILDLSEASTRAMLVVSDDAEAEDVIEELGASLSISATSALPAGESSLRQDNPSALTLDTLTLWDSPYQNLSRLLEGARQRSRVPIVFPSSASELRDPVYQPLPDQSFLYRET